MSADVHPTAAPRPLWLPIRAATPPDQSSIAAFLADAGLPVADLAASAPMFWVAAIEGQMEGLVGLERHGDAGLLRSLAVSFSGRGHGLGTRLVDHVEREAAALGIGELVLLTETAADFFAGLGYRTVGRDAVPQAIRDSAEFRALCPASATCMCKAIR